MGLLTWLGLRRTNVWERPTVIDEFLSSPLQSVIRRIFRAILFLRGRPFRPARDRRRIRVVCISDTHSRTVADVPDGDLLVHAGDLTDDGTADSIQRQVDWLDSLPHRHKVFVCGNHDSWFDPAARGASDRESGRAPDLKSLRYLQNESVTLEFEGGRRLNVYGAGDIPLCGGSDFAYVHGTWLCRDRNRLSLLISHPRLSVFNMLANQPLGLRGYP